MYYSWKDRVDFSLLKGRVCSGVESTDYEIIFYLEDNLKLVMQHDQDCCESVYVESIVGDLKDIVGEEILIAEEVTVTFPSDSVSFSIYELIALILIPTGSVSTL